MDDLFDNADDDFFSFDSAAAGDGEDDFLLPRTRRRRLYSPPPPSSSLRHDRLFFVSFRWWKDSMADCLNGEDGKRLLYTASSHGAECESGADIVLRLDRQEDDDDDEKVEGFSGREYALISESMWFKAVKWHSDYCTTIKDIRCSLAAEDNGDDVFPIQIRLSMIWHSKSVVAKICHMKYPYAACGIKQKDLIGCSLVWIPFFTTKERKKTGKRKEGEKVKSDRHLQHYFSLGKALAIVAE